MRVPGVESSHPRRPLAGELAGWLAAAAPSAPGPCCWMSEHPLLPARRRDKSGTSMSIPTPLPDNSYCRHATHTRLNVARHTLACTREQSISMVLFLYGCTVPKTFEMGMKYAWKCDKINVLHSAILLLATSRFGAVLLRYAHHSSQRGVS